MGSMIRSNWSCCHYRPCPCRWRRRRRYLPLLVCRRRWASSPGSYGRASSFLDSINTFLPWSGRRCLQSLLGRWRSTIRCPCLVGLTDPLPLLCPLHTDGPPSFVLPIHRPKYTRIQWKEALVLFSALSPGVLETLARNSRITGLGRSVCLGDMLFLLCF